MIMRFYVKYPSNGQMQECLGSFLFISIILIPFAIVSMCLLNEWMCVCKNEWEWFFTFCETNINMWRLSTHLYFLPKLVNTKSSMNLIFHASTCPEICEYHRNLPNILSYILMSSSVPLVIYFHYVGSCYFI